MEDFMPPPAICCPGCDTALELNEVAAFSKIRCPECDTEINIPLRFDRYLLDRVCGRGGMSRVYVGSDTELFRPVAIKILQPQVAGEVNEQQFLSEARLVTRLNHPGFVPIYDCGVWRGCPFLVMKFMAKGNLESMLKKRQLPGTRVMAEHLANIADGLMLLHKNGFAHHDIKPGNILMDDQDHAALADFDLMANSNQGDTGNTESWVSPAYSSPERLYNGYEDHRGDIFSFGITAYELLTGQPPFELKGEPRHLYEQRKHPLFLPAHDLNPELSETTSKLLNRMLAFQPAERPAYPEIVATLKKEAEGRNKGFFARIFGKK